jgi:Subtilase family/Carbohydrate binding module (family 6)
MRKETLQRAVVIEELEGRQLLAWGQIPQLISLDDARARFPSIDGRGQTIAVIDSGVNMSHPKIVDSVFKNPAEVVDGKDNDGDGYIDDVNGWDFLANDRDPKDEQGHGTMVASTLAANRFTNTGNPHLAGSADYKEYEGVASAAKILPLRISGTNLTFSDANLEKALQYVIKNRVRFNITAVNFSLAVTSGGWSRIQDEVATLSSAGVFMAGVSGNGGFVSSSGSKPGDSPYAMSVGAANPDGSVNSITIRGSWLDIVAPGNKVPYLDRGTSYWVGGAGTSYAAPWVTATGVLIKQVNRNFSTEQIRQIIHDSGQNVYDPMSKLTFKRLDVAAAIDLAYKRSGAAVPSAIQPTPVPPPTPVTGTRSAFSTIAAASYNTSKGVNKSGSGISYVDGGDYVGYNNINFGTTGATKLSVNLAVPASFAGKKIVVRVGGATGQIVGTLVTRGTGGWGAYQTQTISISRVTGVKSLFLTFEGGSGVGNIAWFKFA